MERLSDLPALPPAGASSFVPPCGVRVRSSGSGGCWRRGSSLLCAALIGLSVFAFGARDAYAQPFTFLQPGFTQELIGIGVPTDSTHIFGGIAFGPHDATRCTTPLLGCVWTVNCLFQTAGEPMFEFDLAAGLTEGTSPVTNYHPLVPGGDLTLNGAFASGAGCGLVNHPDGFLYSNINDGNHGVARLDATTGAVVATLGAGFPVGAVKSRVYYALKALRVVLAERGVSP